MQIVLPFKKKKNKKEKETGENTGSFLGMLASPVQASAPDGAASLSMFSVAPELTEPYGGPHWALGEP